MLPRRIAGLAWSWEFHSLFSESSSSFHGTEGAAPEIRLGERTANGFAAPGVPDCIVGDMVVAPEPQGDVNRMTGELGNFIPSMVVLGIVGMIAFSLTVNRSWAGENLRLIPGAVRLAVIAVISQAAHFTEEFLTGFHEQFPALFGLAPISVEVFAGFNVAWLAIWSLSIWGLTALRRPALFPLWFLGIGCALNGVAHPALSVFTQGYFPGLVTSPLVGVLGVLLLRRLHAVTRAVDQTPGAVVDAKR